MKKAWRKGLLIVVCMGALSAFALTGVGSASAAKAGLPGRTKAALPGNAASRVFSKAEQRATARYWTPSRIASARPISIRVKAGRAAGAGTVDRALIGTPTVVPPAGPAATAAATPVARSLGGPVSPASTVYAYPAPFTRYALFPNSQYNVYPNRVHGKLFFSQHTPSGDGNFVCSGTVVTSAGHWLVETAGHCVANSGTHTFSFNIRFVPAYRSGTAPFGSWTAFRLWTKADWINNGNIREDRGFILLRKNSSGHRIQDVIGSEGIAFNQSYLQHVVDFGYPVTSPFTGATEQLCLASFEETDPFNADAGSLPWGIGCDQTGGSSGGGWVIRYKQGGGFVNGHNDYSYTSPSRPLEMFSPYFDDSELSLYNCATDNVC
jgi:V8-like Glu-specific endopeptidase